MFNFKRKGSKAAKATAEPTFWRGQLRLQELDIHRLLGAMRGHPAVVAAFDEARQLQWDESEESAEFILTRALPELKAQARRLGVLPETPVTE